MAEILELAPESREAAHDAASAAYRFMRRLIENGRKCLLVAREHVEDRSLQQNRYYWGVVLKEIAQQAALEGQRWTAEAWHELFKRTFLGYEIKRTKVAGRKHPVVTRRLRSTKDLSVKAMSAYLDEIQAFATTDLGVRFSELDWREYRG